MDLRFVAMITGCMLIGAGAAAYHRADGLFSPARATLASAAPEVPLFMQAAVGAPTPTAWPSGGSVTFHDEMLALRSTLAAAAVPTRRRFRPARMDRSPMDLTAIPIAADFCRGERSDPRLPSDWRIALP